jgi:WD40 repeat protein
MKITKQFTHHSPIHSLDTYTYNSTTNISIGLTNGTLLFNTTPHKNHSGAILCVRYHPLGTFLTTTSDDKSTVLYTADESEIILVKKYIKHTSDVVSIAYFDGCNGISDNKNISNDERIQSNQDDLLNPNLIYLPTTDPNPFTNQYFLATAEINGTITLFDNDLKLISTFNINTTTIGMLLFQQSIILHAPNKLLFLDYHGKIQKVLEDNFNKTIVECMFSRMYCYEQIVFVGLGCNGNKHSVECLSFLSSNINIVSMNDSVTVHNKKDVVDGSDIVDINNILNNSTTPNDSLTINKTFSLIGHVAPIECVSFNKKDRILAAASQDNSISLWTLNKPTPFLLLKNITTSPVLDLRWTTDGTKLFCCTFKSDVISLEFYNEELNNSISMVKD